MGVLIKDPPGLPAGWRVVHLRQSTRHPRDAVVLCERINPLANQSNFVVWTANMIEGGCSGGGYHTDFSAAQGEFAKRAARLA